MEFRPQEIAQLVLGYLKIEKCPTAFVEFLNSSPYLTEHARKYHRGKCIITRVAGRNLVDYLTEYAAIYTIVQAQLEASDYFNEYHSTTTLAKQLLYLLDNTGIQSRTSTPIHHNEEIIRNPPQRNIDNISAQIQHTSKGSKNNSFDKCVGVNAGELSFLDNSKNKSTSSVKEDKSTNTDDSEQMQILSQTLLEKSDFIEKIVENINIEVSSKSNSKLDNTSIQSIVQRTQADPAFEEILSELIGLDDGIEEEISSSSPEKSAEDENVPEAVVGVPDPATPQKSQDNLLTSDSLKQRLRSTKKAQAPPNKDVSIEDQNNDAIQSIVAASLSNENQQLEPEANSNSNISIETILPVTNYDNVIQNSYTGGINNQNQIYTNTGGLLMLQPNATMPCTTVVPTRPLDPPKSCYIFGNQQFVNAPQNPFKVLTEQEILAMPTIFVCDNQQPINNQTVMVSQPAVVGQNRLVNIAPKTMSPEKGQSLRDYITLYQCADSYTAASPPKSKPRTKSKQTTTATTIKKEAVQQTQTEQPSLPTFSNLTQQATTDNTVLENAEIVAQKPIVEAKHVTPKPKVNDKKGSTPRSGSHVRQLDFSTPEKWASLIQNASPKSEKDPAKTNKTNTKNIRTTLFAESASESTAENLKKQNVESEDITSVEKIEVPEEKSAIAKGTAEERSWDADLRALAGPCPSAPAKTIPVPQRPKRKCTEESPKQSKKLKESEPNLNKTEEDALKIEMALAGMEANEISNAPSENIAQSTSTTNKSNERPCAKKVGGSKKSTKNSKGKQTVKPVEVTETPPSDRLTAISVKVDEESSEVIDTEKKSTELNLLDGPCAVIKRNMKSRIKKKCNIESTVKKPPVQEEIVLTTVTKIKSCEILEDGQNTLILSPSKLNANKRSLVDIDMRNLVVEPNVSTKPNESEIRDMADGKPTSPELEKTSTNQPPATVKKNMMPLLETPVKFDSAGCPKTPGIITNSPFIDTPFAKAIIDQLTGVDINAIPTPRFPITPHFPFTPAHDQSPYSNRGTDYSTSSSYYQPSDTEQNKSLEQLIEECRRLENQQAAAKTPSGETGAGNWKSPEKINTCPETATLSVSPNKSKQRCENPVTPKMLESCVVALSEPGEEIKHALSLMMEKQKAFNQSIIGKKNLNLMKVVSKSDEEKASSCESSSSESECNTTVSSDDGSNYSFAVEQTAITKQSPYSLRPRKANITNSNVNINPSKEKGSASTSKDKTSPNSGSKNKASSNSSKDKAPLNTSKDKASLNASKDKASLNSSGGKEGSEDAGKEKEVLGEFKNPANKTEAINSELPVVVQTKPLTFQENLLKQMEQIRQRTIAKFKDTTAISNPNDSKKKKPLPKPKITGKEKQKVPAGNGNIRSSTKAEKAKEKTDVSNKATLDKPTNISNKKQRKSNSPKKIQLPETQKNESIVTSNNVKSKLEVSKQFRQSETDVNYKNICGTPAAITDEVNKPSTSKTALKGNNPKKTELLTSESAGIVVIKQAKAIVDEEEDIILHLSSDEEDLEPFEMVETELLESSISSTPIAEEDISCMTSNLPHAQEASIPEGPEEVVDPEAESLVKGLKQWGIHLVPNKPTKKSSSSAEIKNYDTESKGAAETSKSFAPGNAISKKKSVTEKPKAKENDIKNKEKSESSKKEQDSEKSDLNRSLEEGELVSDEDTSPKKKTRLEISKPPSKLQLRRNSDYVKERKYRDRERNSKEVHRPRTLSESKSKYVSSKSRDVNKSKNETLSNTINKIIMRTSGKLPEIESSDKAKIAEEKESLYGETDYEAEFDVRTYEQETLRIRHDYSKRPSRKLSDYNFNILSKKFSANVYIAEIDSEVEKVLEFTPFQFLLEVPPTSTNKVPPKQSSIDKKPSSKTEPKKKSKPLTILYNQLVKPADDSPRQISSPLDNLYAPEPSSNRNRIPNEKNNKPSEKSAKRTEKSDKSKQKLFSTKDSSSSIKKISVPECATKSSSKSMQGSSSNKQENKEELVSDLEVVDGVIMLNSNSDKEKDDDELMNYALVGSERIPDGEETAIIENKKRKPSDAADAERHQEKKQKSEVCQELLRNIDVDSFLKKLHGET